MCLKGYKKRTGGKHQSECLLPLLEYIFAFCLCFCSYGNHRYGALVFSTRLKHYSTIYQGVESVVATHTDVLTRMERCASLTNDDVACLAELTTENLYA